jgi:D-arabinose 1-dehydrogenase-like Zn-dependent alcohol dehydrogenase
MPVSSSAYQAECERLGSITFAELACYSEILKLGALHYIDSSTQNVAEALTALGGAKVILATVTSGKAMNAAGGGLAIDGKLMIVGVSEEPLEMSPPPAYYRAAVSSGLALGNRSRFARYAGFQRLGGGPANDRGVPARARR